MASLRRVPGSRYWIACYTDATGKQRQRSTKETDRKKAMSRAHEYEAAYRRVKSEEQARRVISDIYEEIHGTPLTSTTIRKYLGQWIKRKEAEVSPSSHRRYERVIEQFLKYLGTNADRQINFVTVSEITEFRDSMLEKSSVSTTNLTLKVLRTVFQDAVRESLIEKNPASLVPTLRAKTEGVKRRAFTLEELKTVINHAPSEWEGMILTGLYTGQRLGDIARLCWNNIDLPRGEIRFIAQKTGRAMILPIAEPLMEWLMENASKDDPDAAVFPGAYEIVTEQGHVATLSNQFNRILSAAGLIEKRSNASKGKGRTAKREMSQLSFHCLRHTATSLLKNAGVSEAVAMDIIGHNSKLISLNYTHIEEKTKRKALDNLPDITKEQND